LKWCKHPESLVEVSTTWIAIKQSQIKREELFVTSKLWTNKFEPEKVSESFFISLEKLQTDYVDLFLLHRPRLDFDHTQTIYSLLELQQKWLIRNIWVSNFPVLELEKIINIPNFEIFCNQIEMHPFLIQEKTIKYCQDKKIYLTAYSPLARGQVFENSIIQNIAKKYNKTISQIALRRIVQKYNAIVIPKTKDKNRMIENLDIDNFELQAEDIDQISKLPKNIRLVNPQFAPKWDI